VATRIALRHPDRVLAAHVSAVAPKRTRQMGHRRPRPSSPIGTAAPSGVATRAATRRSRVRALKPGLCSRRLPCGSGELDRGEVPGLDRLQRRRSIGLSDGDPGRQPDGLLDDQHIGSSTRYYYEAARIRPPLKVDDYVLAPTAVAMWPHDIAVAPRELAERLYNVQRYRVFPRGGHFPAWEAPELYAMTCVPRRRL